MKAEIKCTYYVEYEEASFDINMDGWTKIFPREEIKKNVFIPLKKVLESKIGAMLNKYCDNQAVSYLCEWQIKNKEEITDWTFEMKYDHNNDEYMIEEHEDHLIVKCVYEYHKKKYKQYKIKDGKCNCFSFRMGNSKYGKKNCKHMEMVRNAPIEMK